MAEEKERWNTRGQRIVALSGLPFAFADHEAAVSPYS